MSVLTSASQLPEGWPEDWRNRLIWGDNKYVLASLLDEFAGKVDLIYIDPPYNTGNDFIYRDNFIQDKNEYDEEIGAIDDAGNKMFKENTM